MILSYKILFRIDLLHEYYRDGRSRNFSIDPSEETVKLFAKYGLIFKVVDASIVILVRVDKMMPVVQIPDDIKFTFYTTISDQSFLTVTSIKPELLSDRIFYFSNNSNNKTGSVLNLSMPLDHFNSSQTYVPGDFVISNAEEVFECIKTGAGNDIDASGSRFWALRHKTGYVSDKDMVVIYPERFICRCSVPSTNFDIKIYGIDQSTGNLEKVLIETRIASSSGTPETDVPVDCSKLEPGKYRVCINSENFIVYTDNSAVKRKVNGIIELFTFHKDMHPYSMIDASGEIKSVNYSILFANRRAHWKYTPVRKEVKGILDRDNHDEPGLFTGYPVSGTVKDYFISNAPLLLSEDPKVNNFDIQLELAYFTAPKPDPRNTVLLTQAFDAVLNRYTDYYCTMYVNY